MYSLFQENIHAISGLPFTVSSILNLSVITICHETAKTKNNNNILITKDRNGADGTYFQDWTQLQILQFRKL